jgi:intracellular sulfur oxidation DsrE/DsrF family protein
VADYREISQQYAQKGIGAAFLVNSGAAVALLSQAGDLIKAGLADDVARGMMVWACGTTLAAITWVLAFLATRYVDKSVVEDSSAHLATSNKLMLAGLVSVILSLAFFVAGCLVVARAFLRSGGLGA